MVSVSIIVPVFNSETYLNSCLDSILNQTVSDTQVICIDDCSTDGSRTILESYVERDNRVSLVRFSAHRGPGAARNAGIEKATGKYLRMVDSDDFIPLDSTEKMVQAAEQYGSDFVRGGVRRGSHDGNPGRKAGRYPERLIINRSFRNDNELWYFDQHTSYLHRTDIVKASGARYDEKMGNGEDVVFLLPLMIHMQRVTLIPVTVYYYRRNQNSLVNSRKDTTYYYNLFRLYELEYEQLVQQGFKEPVDFFLYYHLGKILPGIVLPSIPVNLSKDEGIMVLEYLKTIFDKYNVESLCFGGQYKWQDEKEIPLLSKQVVVLLAKGYLTEIWDTLNQHLVMLRKIEVQKKSLRALRSSTSWRVTAPLRHLVDLIRK